MSSADETCGSAEARLCSSQSKLLLALLRAAGSSGGGEGGRAVRERGQVRARSAAAVWRWQAAAVCEGQRKQQRESRAATMAPAGCEQAPELRRTNAAMQCTHTLAWVKAGLCNELWCRLAAQAGPVDAAKEGVRFQLLQVCCACTHLHGFEQGRQLRNATACDAGNLPVSGCSCAGWAIPCDRALPVVCVPQHPCTACCACSSMCCTASVAAGGCFQSQLQVAGTGCSRPLLTNALRGVHLQQAADEVCGSLRQAFRHLVLCFNNLLEGQVLCGCRKLGRK